MGKKGGGKRLASSGKGVKAKYKVLNNCDPGDKTASKLSREENKILPLCLKKKKNEEIKTSLFPFLLVVV